MKKFEPEAGPELSILNSKLLTFGYIEEGFYILY